MNENNAADLCTPVLLGCTPENGDALPVAGDIRRIETPMDNRVESGPIVFDHCGPTGGGYDWPGVFLRGDLCRAARPALLRIARHYRETAPGSALWNGVEAGYLEQIIGYMEQATKKPDAQPVAEETESCEHPYNRVYRKMDFEKCTKCGKILCEG
jgi:hypothetical protein